jgi:CRP-like cAMP-binding protein
MQSTSLSPIEQFTARLHGLSPLSTEDRQALEQLRGIVIQAKANTDLVPPGDAAEYCHLVVEGLVGRFAQFSDGARLIVALYVPGDMADLHSVATPQLAPPLQALTTCTLIRYPLRELRSAVSSRPALAQAFWAYSSVDASVIGTWAASLGRKSAVGRMAHLLCEIGLRMEQSGRGDRSHFTLELTQSQLGEALGLTPVHVNRTLKALRTQALVAVSARTFQIADWDKLAKVGEFDPCYLQMTAATSRAASCLSPVRSAP